jgi:hypothetical protein
MGLLCLSSRSDPRLFVLFAAGARPQMASACRPSSLCLAIAIAAPHTNVLSVHYFNPSVNASNNWRRPGRAFAGRRYQITVSKLGCGEMRSGHYFKDLLWKENLINVVTIFLYPCQSNLVKWVIEGAGKIGERTNERTDIFI